MCWKFSYVLTFLYCCLVYMLKRFYSHYKYVFKNFPKNRRCLFAAQNFVKMNRNDNLILRVQSPEGTKRVQILPDDTTLKLYEAVRAAFDLPGYLFALYKERGRKQEMVSSRSKRLVNYALGHGDVIYMEPVNGSIFNPEPSTSSSLDIPAVKPRKLRPSTSTSESNSSSISVVEDEVDVLLWKQSGKIERSRDSKYCRHGDNGRCVHCSPLEPFDEGYLKEQNIKHLSFHAHLRKLTAGVNRGKFVTLEPVSCKIKPGCIDHPPWPKGVCSKCTPHAITLNRQTYRHIDNVVMENPQIVDRFLDYWRSTGHQRVGFLYGKYEVHSDVPLGIRATVSVIYEPPQESNSDNIRLLADDREAFVTELAHALGLVRVGWIFTDLIADETQSGSVKHLRHVDSHFLSAQECIMAGYFQNKHLNPCRFSPTGYFGSKFVTICVTGDSKKQVHMEGYQVSEQCMSLVRDDCLIPTKDAPELGYVPESTDQKYVPDVFYKVKDMYGNEVSRLARPLPIAYLLVDVPASTPMTPQYTFACLRDAKPFPVENRLLDGHVQDLGALSTYLAQFTPEQFLAAASDFHFLLYIATMKIFPLQDCIGPLLEAVRKQDASAAAQWAESMQWATVEELMAASGGSTGGRASSRETAWTCSRCTFMNAAQGSSCEMCGHPRFEGMDVGEGNAFPPASSAMFQ